MAWHDIAPDGFGSELRQAVLAAFGQAYDENCRRFAPEDVGDNNISFSHTVRENLRYLLQRQIHELTERHIQLAGKIEVYWKGLVYELRLPGNARLHIYKAPPGITDVRKLRFNGSKRQIEILKVNADQLALNLEAALGHDVAQESDGAGRQIVVVHFGGPIDGLGKVIVGEPFLSNLDAPDWLWIEDLVEETMLYEREREPELSEAIASDDVMDDDFDDLRLRDDAESGGDATGTEGQ